MRSRIFIVLSVFIALGFTSCQDEYMDTKDAGNSYISNKSSEGDSIQVLPNTDNGVLYQVVFNNPYGEYINQESMSIVSTTVIPRVIVNYTVYFLDGTVFVQQSNASLVYASQPLGIQLALRKMRIGSKWKIWLRQDFAYGSDGWENDKGGYFVDPYTSLIYDIEFLGVQY